MCCLLDAAPRADGGSDPIGSNGIVGCGRDNNAVAKHHDLRRFVLYAGPLCDVTCNIALPTDRNEIHGRAGALFAEPRDFPVGKQANGASVAVFEDDAQPLRYERIELLDAG